MKYYVKVLIILLLCVLVPCITVLVVTNTIIFDQYKESVSTSQLNRLQTIDNTNQFIFENIEQGALRFSLDPSIQSLSDFTTLQPSHRENKYLTSLRRAMTMLNDFVSTNKLVDSVYLYIDNSDYIISSRESVVSLDRFADLSWMAKYEEQKTNQNANPLIPTHIVKSGYNTPGIVSTAYERQCLTYVYYITPYISNFNGALIFNIYEDKLLQTYAEPDSDSNIALFDHNGTWITGVSNINFTDILSVSDWNRIFRTMKTNDERLHDNYFVSNNGNSSYQCTYYHSKDDYHVLVSLDEVGMLMKKAASSQIILLVFFLLFVPFVALLIFWGSRRLYSPIGNLVQELNANDKLELSKDEKDDWSAILQAVNELLREDRKLFSVRAQEKLKEATFLRILSGDHTEDDEEESKTILPYEHNLCILAAIDAHSSLFSKVKNFESRISLLIRLIEDGLSGEGMYPTVMRYEDNAMVVLLSMDKNISSFESALRSKLTMIQTKTSKIMDHTISFAISSLIDHSDNVRLFFTQAKNAMQYRFMKGSESILFYDQVCSAHAYYNADERLKYIQHCLYSCKKEEMLQGIQELVNDIKSEENISFIYTGQILNQLVTSLAQYTNDNDIHLEELRGDNTGIYQRLWQNITLEDACHWFCGIAATVMEHVRIDSKSEYIRQALEYVHEKYTECITIDAIADQIGISYSYLRRLYKESTGQNLSDYINQLRIQKAKKLLKETNYTVKEIVFMCGYNHERTFFRSFTQMVGISPSKYRSKVKTPRKA